MKLHQEEICTSKGRESRYQVWALDEDGKPAQYVGVEDSPVGKYALIDRLYKNSIMVSIDAEDYEQAYEQLRTNHLIDEKEEI